MPVGDRPAHPLDAKEALRIVTHPDPKYRGGARDRAIMAVMWRCGLRCGEVVDLDLDHIVNSNGPALRIMKPKGFRRGAKPREVGLDPETHKMIKHWLTFRGRKRGPLFTTRNDTRIDTRAMRRMVKVRARKAGIERRVSPHTFRHTLAKELYEAKYGMVHIQKVLGHSTLATTANYLAHISSHDIVSVTAERKWNQDG